MSTQPCRNAPKRPGSLSSSSSPLNSNASRIRRRGRRRRISPRARPSSIAGDRRSSSTGPRRRRDRLGASSSLVDGRSHRWPISECDRRSVGNADHTIPCRAADAESVRTPSERHRLCRLLHRTCRGARLHAGHSRPTSRKCSDHQMLHRDPSTVGAPGLNRRGDVTAFARGVPSTRRPR